MKKCPYCAEEIQDEAILCRYCHSDVRVPPPPPKPQVILIKPDDPEAQAIKNMALKAMQAKQEEPEPTRKAGPWTRAFWLAVIFTIIGTISSLGAGDALFYIAAFIFFGSFIVWGLILSAIDGIRKGS